MKSLFELLTKPYFIAELFAFFCSLLVIKKRNYPAHLKLLIPYLFATLVVEYIGYYVIKVEHYKSNHFVYNAYVPMSIMFYLYIILKSHEDSRIRKSFFYISIGYLTFVIINLTLLQGADKYASFNLIIGGIIVSVTSTLYLIELLKNPDNVLLFSTNTFWIAIGLLLYYFPKTILFTTIEYFSYIKSDMARLSSLFKSINTVLIIILYSCISMNFLCSAKRD